MRYVLSLVLVLVFPLALYAQTNALDVTLTTTPENPTPGSTFSVQATSYSGDLNLAMFSWTYNGKVVATGIGKTSVSLVAPSAGMVSTVGATISGGAFDATTTTLRIQPASIDLIWEASDSYTPPFYKGKALLSTGGGVRVGAVAAGSAPKGLSYVWKRNDAAIQSASGYNKNSINFTADILKSREQVSVEVVGGIFQGKNTLTIPVGDPILVLYQNNEGFISYSNGNTSAVAISGSGTILHFEPYFFSVPRSIPDDLSVTLSEGGSLIDSDNRLTELSVTRPSSGGTSTLQAAVDTVEYGLQHLVQNFIISFN